VNFVGLCGIIFNYKQKKNKKLNNNYTPGTILPKSINFCVKDTQIKIINTMQSQKTYLNKKLNNIYYIYIY